MRPIVILGMQRSGTSALSGALARLGVSFGDPSILQEGDANNPRGYFEHRQVTMLNLRALGEFQMHVTSFESLPERWREYPQAAELRTSLVEFLRSEFGNRPLWALKHPLISLLLPLYNAAFAELGLEPQYLVCVRNPLETMESESRLDFGGGYRVMQPLGKMAIGSWLRYTLGSVCEALPHSVSIVPYDQLLSDPRTILESIVAGQAEWSPSSSEWEDALGSIEGGLRRNRRSVSELDYYPSLVRRAYEAACAGSSLEGLYREFKVWVRMMGDAPAPPGKLGLSWMDSGQLRVAEVDYDVVAGWQTVRLRVDAPPKAALSGLIYGLPARIWIRSSFWHLTGGVAHDRESHPPTRLIQPEQDKGGSRVKAPIACGPSSLLTQANGVARLDAAFEPQQIRLTTPEFEGPYELEIEFLLETGALIQRETAARLSKLLDRCTSEGPQVHRVKR